MSLLFKELDNQQTPLGELSLRVRASVSQPDTEIYEVTLNGEFLMSSFVNDSERALGRLALQAVEARPCDVLVGGLGLGYTAAAALEWDNVRSLRVIEYLEPVIQWHREHLVPAARGLMADPRCEIVHDDFFAHFREDPDDQQAGLYDAILLDIDHSPDALLDPQHARFYSEDGLRLMSRRLRAGGVFALWSADPPADSLLVLLRQVFQKVERHAVTFYNPLHDREEENTVVLAHAGGLPNEIARDGDG